jgi:hypothetical protein
MRHAVRATKKNLQNVRAEFFVIATFPQDLIEARALFFLSLTGTVS